MQYDIATSFVEVSNLTTLSSEDLSRTIDSVRLRIEQVEDLSRRIGEQNTKATLIEPVLAALGWDLHDLDEISREYRHKPQDNPVDYALFILGSPRLFIEAKEIGTNLRDRKWISQVLSYATVAGVEWCVLTNGNNYDIYNSHAPVDVEEKLFRSIELTDAPRDEYVIETLRLLSKPRLEQNQIDALWRAHDIDEQVRSALKDILRPDNQSIVRLIRSRVSDLSPAEIRASIQRARIGIDYPLLQRIPIEPQPPTSTKVTGSQSKSVTIQDLINAEIINPPLELERPYKGIVLKAVIVAGGDIVYEGVSYYSPSTSAGMARKSVIGAPEGRKYPQTNGWTFWKYRDVESGNLVPIDNLRQKYLNHGSNVDRQ